jgi:hypothetical protein
MAVPIAGLQPFRYHARPYPDWSRSGFFDKAENGFKFNQLSFISGELK